MWRNPGENFEGTKKVKTNKFEGINWRKIGRRWRNLQRMANKSKGVKAEDIYEKKMKKSESQNKEWRNKK